MQETNPVSPEIQRCDEQLAAATAALPLAQEVLNKRNITATRKAVVDLERRIHSVNKYRNWLLVLEKRPAK